MIIEVSKATFADGQVNKTVLLREIAKFTDIVPTFDPSLDPVAFDFATPPEPEFEYQLQNFIAKEHKGGNKTPYVFQVANPDIEAIANQVKGIAGYAHIGSEGATITVWFSSDLSAADVVTLTAAVGNLVPAGKKKKNDAIDIKTRVLIMAGFEYPAGSGNIHSYSERAQINLLGIPDAAADPATSYPVKTSTRDNGAVIHLDNPPALKAFYAASRAHKATHIASGNDLKEQVLAATDMAGVSAVADDR